MEKFQVVLVIPAWKKLSKDSSHLYSVKAVPDMRGKYFGKKYVGFFCETYLLIWHILKDMNYICKITLFLMVPP